jgi:hypothetical protein
LFRCGFRRLDGSLPFKYAGMLLQLELPTRSSASRWAFRFPASPLSSLGVAYASLHVVGRRSQQLSCFNRVDGIFVWFSVEHFLSCSASAGPQSQPGARCFNTASAVDIR